MFDFLVSEYQKMYFKGEWPGFYNLWLDWKGNRWLLLHLLSWHKDFPEWLDKEGLQDINLNNLL